MASWERIRAWANRSGWRGIAPVAGSVAVHSLIGIALASILSTQAKPSALLSPGRDRPFMDVSLLTDLSAPETGRASLPVGSAPSGKPGEPASDHFPEPSAEGARDAAGVAVTEPGSAGSVWLGPSPFSAPAAKGGIEGLLGKDPCSGVSGLKPRECGTDWAAKWGNQASLAPRTKEDLRRYYSEFIPPCPRKVGCEGGEWRSNSGTRSVYSYNGSPMMSGAGGLGGINELTGRLGFNPDATDPGFGD